MTGERDAGPTAAGGDSGSADPAGGRAAEPDRAADAAEPDGAELTEPDAVWAAERIDGTTPTSAPRRRRARTAPPPGSDPHPTPEPDRHDTTENDARLRADKPPHY